MINVLSVLVSNSTKHELTESENECINTSKEKSYFDFNVDEFVKCQSMQRLFVFALFNLKNGTERKGMVGK